MHPSDPNQILPSRRKLLGGIASAAALAGLSSAAVAAPVAGRIEPANMPEQDAPETTAALNGHKGLKGMLSRMGKAQS